LVTIVAETGRAGRSIGETAGGMTQAATGDGAHSFELRNDLTEIATLADTLERFCIRHGIGSDVSSVVNLALEEVVTTIIAHGYPDGGDHRIWIDLAVDGATLTARVQDDAASFEPGEREDPALDMVRSLMDDVTYRREQGRNVLLIRKSTGP
jgi:anti-sigma regulatory factor (Ser/Thr protein kinase)